MTTQAGVTTFCGSESQRYSYVVTWEAGKLRLCLQEPGGSKQWETQELTKEEYVGPANAVIEATSPDYAMCLKEWLDCPLGSDVCRELTLLTNESLQVDISLDVRLLGAILASEKYRFELQPVPLEDINARLRKKLVKQNEELAGLRKREQEHKQGLERELKKARLDPAPSNSPLVCFRTTFASICSMRRVGWAKVPVGLFAVTDDAQIRCLRAGQYIFAMVLQFDPLKRRLAFHLLKNLEFIRRAECAQGDTSLTSILVLEVGDELTLNYTSGVPMSGHFAAIRLGD